MSLVASAYSISDKESVETARALLSKEGILAGSSSGTLLAAALRYCREQTAPKRVVTLVCDSGNKYLSKIYNDYWVIEQGLADRKLHGDLSDLIARRFDAGGSVTVAPDDTLLDRLQSHARGGCVAIAGGEGQAHRRHPRRERYSGDRRRGRCRSAPNASEIP